MNYKKMLHTIAVNCNETITRRRAYKLGYALKVTAVTMTTMPYLLRVYDELVEIYNSTYELECAGSDCDDCPSEVVKCCPMRDWLYT
jgi:hypothetical protein